MTFFEDSRGNYHPVSQIVCIRPKRAEVGKFQTYPYRIQLADEDSVEAAECVVRNVVRASGEVIPAQPETFLLTFCPGDAADPEPVVWRSVVIGFRVRADYGSLDPLVIDSDFDEMTGVYGILHPSGSVECAAGETYETESQWFAEQVRMSRVMAESKVGGGSW